MWELDALNIGWMKLHQWHLIPSLNIPHKQVLPWIWRSRNYVFGVWREPALQISHMLKLHVLVVVSVRVERRVELAFKSHDHRTFERIQEHDGVLASTHPEVHTFHLGKTSLTWSPSSHSLLWKFEKVYPCSSRCWKDGSSGLKLEWYLKPLPLELVAAAMCLVSRKDMQEAYPCYQSKQSYFCWSWLNITSFSIPKL